MLTREDFILILQYFYPKKVSVEIVQISAPNFSETVEYFMPSRSLKNARMELFRVFMETGQVQMFGVTFVKHPEDEVITFISNDRKHVAEWDGRIIRDTANREVT